MAENSFDEILNKIANNPDLINKINEIAKSGGDNPMDKLPLIIDAISPSISSSEKSDEKPEKTDTPADKSENSDLNILSQIPLPLNKISEKISKNSKLLIALKPYLSKGRSDIIDSIVKMAQVAELMKNVK